VYLIDYYRHEYDTVVKPHYTKSNHPSYTKVGCIT